MASVTTFIRNMPASSLQAYFNHTGITLPSPIDWSAPEPEIARVTLRLVDEMNDEDRARVVNDGERVSALADDAGQTALYSVIDDRTIMDDLANGHARSLWMFLNEPVRFRHAEEVRFTDERRRGRSWDGFICDPNCVVRQDQTPLRPLCRRGLRRTIFMSISSSGCAPPLMVRTASSCRSRSIVKGCRMPNSHSMKEEPSFGVLTARSSKQP